MKKYLMEIPLLFVVGTVPVCADDFWEEKKAEQWSQKEVIKMITNSPWARKVTVSAQRRQHRPGGRDGAPGPRGRPRSTGGFGGSAGSGGGGAGGSAGRGGGGRGGGTFQSFKLVVRWYSALPIKDALARYQDQPSTSPQATDQVEQAATHYVIGVSGLPDRMFRMSPAHWEQLAEGVKSESFLKIKGHEPVGADAVYARPDRVGILDAKTGAGGGEFLLLFPREGSYAITLEDKKVEFVTKINRMNIKKKFKLKDMIYKGKLEL